MLSEVLSVTLSHPAALVGCGRTDTGVHARQFFAHFDSDTLQNHTVDYWIYKWNSMLPKDIAVHKIIPVNENAHARFSATLRTYQYFIHQNKNPFVHLYSWYYSRAINHKKIQDALVILKQHSDFACFAKDANEYENTNCIIYDANWNVEQEQIIFTISANRFLRNMMRAIVGTLIGIGAEKITITEFENILHSKDRKKAGFSAPPEGLHLTNIHYPKELFIV